MFREVRAITLGEKGLEGDLMAHLSMLGFSSELVQEQASKRAREFVRQGQREEEEEEKEVD